MKYIAIIPYIFNPNTDLIKLEYIEISIFLLIPINIIYLYIFLNKDILKSQFIIIFKLIKFNIIWFLAFIFLCISFDSIFLNSQEYILESIESTIFNNINLQTLLQIIWVLTSFGLILSFFSFSPLVQTIYPIIIIQCHIYLLTNWISTNINDIIFNNSFIKWKKSFNSEYAVKQAKLFLEQNNLMNEIPLTDENLYTFINKNKDFSLFFTQSKEHVINKLTSFYLEEVKAEEISANSINSKELSYYINSSTINLILIIIIISITGIGLYKLISIFNINLAFLNPYNWNINLWATRPLDSIQNNDLAKENLKQINEILGVLKQNNQAIKLLETQFENLASYNNKLAHLSGLILEHCNANQITVDELLENMNNSVKKDELKMFMINYSQQLDELRSIIETLQQGI